MKILKKLSLAAAISAAAISAQAEMTSIDDAVMGDITGQAGVTIVMDTNILIDEVAYKDDGVVAIAGVRLSGTTAEATAGDTNTGFLALTGMTQKIDVAANGNLTIGVDPVSGLRIGVDSIGLRTAAATDNTGDVNFVENLVMTMDMGTSTTTIHRAKATAANLSTANAAAAGTGVVIEMDQSMKITDLDVDVKLGAGTIAIRDVVFSADGTAGGAMVDMNDTYVFADATGLKVQQGNMTGTLTIGSIALGTATSIGSVSVKNINMSGTTMTISGH